MILSIDWELILFHSLEISAHVQRDVVRHGWRAALARHTIFSVLSLHWHFVGIPGRVPALLAVLSQCTSLSSLTIK